MKNKMIRIKDIAVRAGVSTGTVDRVLHKRGEVAEATKEKVLNIVKELEYQPNLIAQALTSKKKYSIACLIPESSKENPFWEKPLKGIEEAEKVLQPFNIDIQIITYKQYSIQEFKEKANKLIKTQPKAVLFAPVYTNESFWFAEQLIKKGIPYLIINSNLELPDKLCYIGQDSYQGAYVAAKLLHINKQNNRRFVIINIAEDYKNIHHFVERNKGFIRYFKENKIEEIVISQEQITGDVENSLDALFIKYTDIDGIYISGSKGFLIAEYLERKDHKQVSLCCFDLINENIHYLNNGIIDFIISQRSFDQGRLGVEVLFNYIAKKEKPAERILMPIDIIIKENLEYHK